MWMKNQKLTESIRLCYNLRQQRRGKTMKQLKKIVILLMAVLVVLSCGGCAALLELMEDEDIRTYTETMLDSLIADDADTAYTLVNDVVDRNSFEVSFGDMQKLIGDVETYELQLLSINWKNNLKNGTSVKTADAVYRMTTATAVYVISVQTMSGYEELTAFYIVPYEKTDYYYTGTMDAMKNATVWQWVALLSNLLIIGIAVWALVDCIRCPIKLKALWIVIIVLGFITVGVTMSASKFNFNFNIGWLFEYSAYILYGGGSMKLRLMLPIGSIVYFVLKKLLIKKPISEPESPVTPLEQGDVSKTVSSDEEGTPS